MTSSQLVWGHAEGNSRVFSIVLRPTRPFWGHVMHVTTEATFQRAKLLSFIFRLFPMALSYHHVNPSIACLSHRLRTHVTSAQVLRRRLPIHNAQNSRLPALLHCPLMPPLFKSRWCRSEHRLPVPYTRPFLRYSHMVCHLFHFFTPRARALGAGPTHQC